MNAEFRILLTLQKGRGRTEMGCQSEGNCTLHVFLLQMSQRGGIIRLGATYQGGVCHCSMYALLFCVLKLCALPKSIAFVAPLAPFHLFIGSRDNEYLRWGLDGSTRASCWLRSLFGPQGRSVWGGAHFTLPPSPKLTAAVKCPALKDCHLKSSSAGPPVWLCSTLSDSVPLQRH